MFKLFRRKRKSDPEKISPAQGPGSQDKDKNTSTTNPTVCLDAPQQPLEVFGLYFEPEGYLVPAKPRLVGDEILRRYTTIERIPSQWVSTDDFVTILAMSRVGFRFRVLRWHDSASAVYVWSPGANIHEINDEWLRRGYEAARSKVEKFFTELRRCLKEDGVLPGGVLQ